MGDILNLQAMIGRGRRAEKIENHFGTICEGIRIVNHISRQSASLDLQAKEGMDKTKSRPLS